MSDDKIDDILLSEIRLNRKAIEKLSDRQMKSEIKNAKLGSFFGGFFGIIAALITKYFH